MSLVRLDETATEPRFRMLTTIREFAVDRLTDASEADSIGERYAAFYLAFAEAVEPELVHASQVEWLDRLEADGLNITAALSWLLARNHIEEGLRLCVAMRFYWSRRTPFAEGNRWLSSFLERLTVEVAPLTRARAIAASGAFNHWLGHLDKALADYQESLDLFRQQGDLVGEARLLRNLASVTIDLGNLDEAESLLTGSRAVADKSGNPRSVSDAIGLLGMLAFGRGDYESAAAQLTEASERYRVVGDIASLMDMLGDAGYMKALSGDRVGAARFLGESLTLALQLGARDRISWALLGVGNLAAELDAAEQAVRLLASAEAIQQSIQEDLRPSVDTIQHRIVAELRDRLGEGAFLAARADGRALSLERAVAEARAVISAVMASES
jgi:tetratricopeptide (TPR) repeat protein